MSKTIWTATNRQGRKVHFDSKLGPVNLIIRCCNCGTQFKGRRSFQDETRIARAAASSHGESHGGAA